MTHLLKQAIAAVRQLPDEEQDGIAAIILGELADEAQWRQAFADSQDTLAEMAAQARADTRAGRVRPGGFGGQ